MSTSTLYRKALILGATSGIGEDLAAKFISQGTSVVVVGRRQDRLDAFVSKYGPTKATGVACDVSDLKAIPQFAARIIQSHPDLDCIVLNAGIQRSFDFSKPLSVGLSTLDLELTTNYTSAVHLTTAFLPFLQHQKSPTTLIYISATLGLCPGMVRTGNYNASKAALHSWVMTTREQLKDNGDNVKMVEVFPPAVQTELHDERHQPDLRGGDAIGMPLKAFTEAAWQGLVEGQDQFGVGDGPKATLLGFEADRQKAFFVQKEMVNKMLSQYLKKSSHS